jgi:hypothetical protein
VPGADGVVEGFGADEGAEGDCGSRKMEHAQSRLVVAKSEMRVE